MPEFNVPPQPDSSQERPERPLDVVTGVLERVTFHSEESGYTVARLAIEGARDLVTVVGNFSNPIVGEMLICEGRWTAHREFGRQFAVERYSTSKPATVYAIEKYLGSGLIKGVGPVMAKRMVDLFGLETLDTIEHDPRKLLRVEGIGEKRVAMIEKAWDEQREIRNVMLFLQEKGVSSTFAVKIYKTYGDRAIATVEANPYRLAQDIRGIGFKTADKIAQQLGVAIDSEQRIEAGLTYTLSEATDFGHLYLPEPKLLTSAAEILGIEIEKLPDVLENMAAAQTVIAEDLTIEMAGRPMRAFYHPALYYTEVGLAAQLRRRLNAPLPKPLSREKIGVWIAAQETAQNITLSDEQKEAVSLALENRVFILTGGPGTGKCVRADSLVLSESGLLPIISHWENAASASCFPDSFEIYKTGVIGKEGLASTSHVYFGGRQATLKIQSNLGLTLEGTQNHRIWAMTHSGPDWVRLDSLQSGDYVAIRRGDNVWGQNALDPEVAYLYGVISGDGSQASSSGIRITNNSIPLLQRCQQTMQAHYGLTARIVPSRQTFDLRADNAAFRRRMIAEGFPICKSEDKTIPISVMQASKSAVTQYLAGLFDTDGHIQCRTSGQVSFEITLKSQRIIQQVQVILLNLGIVSRIAEKKVNYQYKDNPTEGRTYWRLSVFGKDIDRLMSNVPTVKIVPPQERKYNTNRDTVPLPGHIIRALFTANGKRTRREWWQWKREIAGTRKSSRQRLMELLERTNLSKDLEAVAATVEACRDCYYWDKVISVSSSEASVYDLTVPESQSFIANGFVNHNTTVTNMIARAFDAQKKKLLLVSPTGRAAKRLSEVTGRDAQTIHRLLKFDPASHAFQFNETNPVACDVLIADEVSMLDAVLANNLLKAIPEHAQIVFVGDSDQLPSVGAGNVLGDMLDSEVVPSIRLTQVFRQAEASLIVVNAHRIRKGEFPLLVPPQERGTKNCLWVDVDEGATEELPSSAIGTQQIVKLARKSLPALGYGKDDIQILTAMRRGALGVDYLNELLQEALNPADPQGRRPELLRGSRRFRIGDRVIQLVNNYDRNVFNGDVGTIADIKPDDQIIKVRYPEGIVDYDFADYDELQLAFACSIHKSQGSEYPAVVLVMHSSQYMMLQRNLLYTGLTRARKLCILVGDKRAISTAVRNNKTTKRYTRLADRLREPYDPNAAPHERLL